MPLGVLASGAGDEFVDIHVPGWAWLATLALIVGLLLLDLLVLNRDARVPSLRRAAVETLIWVAIGVAFGLRRHSGVRNRRRR